MPDFSLLDNLDQFGNQYYPADDRAVIITKEIWDEIIRTLLNAVQRDPSTAANNDILPDDDVSPLTLRSRASGLSDILAAYDRDGNLSARLESDGFFHPNTLGFDFSRALGPADFDAVDDGGFTP